MRDLLHHHGAFVAGVGGDEAQGFFERPLIDVDADLLVAVGLELVERGDRATCATPPPGTMPSSTAAFVASMASSTRAFFSFISVSVPRPP